MARAVQIKDIAKALGISIGTVDRALHNRGRINPLTKERVLEMARTLGYRPNQAARALSSKRRLRISVNLPSEIALYWDGVREGIREEASAFQAAGVEVEFRSFPRLACGETEAFEAAMSAGVNGMIVATGRPEELRPAIRDAARERVPVVTISTDAPKTARLAVVSIDARASGSLAGELLGRLLQGQGRLAVVTGDLAITDHAEKFESFLSSVGTMFPAIEVVPALQNHEHEIEAYKECKRLLEQYADLGGIYVTTANSTPVLEALKDSGRLEKVQVIATDLFPRLIEHLEQGNVVATLYQRPRSQGQLALRILYNFLVEGRCPSYQVKLAPHLIMKSNLAFFLERLEQISRNLSPKFPSELELAAASTPRGLSKSPKRRAHGDPI